MLPGTPVVGLIDIAVINVGYTNVVTLIPVVVVPVEEDEPDNELDDEPVVPPTTVPAGLLPVPFSVVAVGNDVVDVAILVASVTDADDAGVLPVVVVAVFLGAVVDTDLAVGAAAEVAAGVVAVGAPIAVSLGVASGRVQGSCDGTTLQIDATAIGVATQ